jgi:hypothetical protein
MSYGSCPDMLVISTCILNKYYGHAVPPEKNTCPDTGVLFINETTFIQDDCVI